MLSFRAAVVALLFTATPLFPSMIPDFSECKGQKTISTYIGKDKNVQVEVVQCDGIPLTPESRLLPRQGNICGTQCNLSLLFKMIL